MKFIYLFLFFAISFLKSEPIKACQVLTFIALVEYAVVNVKLREEAENKTLKERQLQKESDEEEISEVSMDETTEWLMGLS